MEALSHLQLLTLHQTQAIFVASSLSIFFLKDLTLKKKINCTHIIVKYNFPNMKTSIKSIFQLYPHYISSSPPRRICDPKSIK